MENICGSKNKALIVRLPPNLYKALEKGEVSDLFLSESGNNLTLELPTELTAATNGVSNFTAQIKPFDKDSSLHAFTHYKKEVTIKALIENHSSFVPSRNQYKANINGPDGDSVRTAVTEENLVYKQVEQRILTLHPDHEAFTLSDPGKAIRNNMRKMMKEKRVRGTPEQVRGMLFELFDKQDHWKRKQLVAETDQPDGIINQVLNEIACKVTTGAFKNHWKLNSTYASNITPDPGPTKKPRNN